MVYMFMYLPNCAYLSVQEVQLYKLSKEKESIALEFKANFCFLGQSKHWKLKKIFMHNQHFWEKGPGSFV